MEEDIRTSDLRLEESGDLEMNNIIKIAVLGKALVGKTALIYRYLNDQIPTRETTVEDQYKKKLKINDNEFELDILDTAGQDDYQTMLEDWIEFASYFLLVYSIEDKESFEQVQKNYEKIVNKKGKNFYGVVIVGNKCDLEENRQIKKEEVEEYANKIKVGNIETSALNNINVNEAFLALVQIYIDKNIDDKKKKKCGCPCF